MHLSTTEKVTFNSVEVAPADFFANDTSVTIHIPASLPDPVNNPIKVTTRYGEATYNFVILQPPPVIASFDPLSGGAGDVVTIKGAWFQNLVSVKFDTLTADIVASTDSTIQVKVPDGVVQAFLYITTSGGTTKSDNAFGFKYIVYDDALAPNWWEGSWSSTVNLMSSAVVKRGTHAIMEQYTGGYGGFQIGNGGASISLAGFQAIKVSLYGGPGTDGKQVSLYLNGVSGKNKLLQLKAGVWSDFTIPLSDLGNPATLDIIVIQEFSNNNSLIYIDDLGLI